MNKIITKEFQGFKVRTALLNDDIWFVAKDSASLLGYKDTDKAIRQHCKRAERVIDIFNPAVLEGLDFQNSFGNNFKNVKLIQEPDVWRLIIKSRLPESQKIEKWIFEEVLPSIRKTGSYTLSKPVENPKNLISVSEQELDRELKALDFILGRMNFSEKDKIDFVNETLERINFPQIKNPHLRKLQPVFTVTELLKDFNVDIRPADFNKKLESFGVIQRSENGWTLADMQFGENRRYGNSFSPRYYRSEFQKLLEIVL